MHGPKRGPLGIFGWSLYRRRDGYDSNKARHSEYASEVPRAMFLNVLDFVRLGER